MGSANAVILGVAVSERNEETGKYLCQTFLDTLKFSLYLKFRPYTNKSCYDSFSD